MRSRRTIDAAILSVIVGILSRRVEAARRRGAPLREDASAAITQAADGTPSMVGKALAGVPPLAEIITRLPVTPLTAFPAARRSRPSLLRPLLVALALTALSIALSLAVTSIIRRRRASGGTAAVIPTAAAAPAPTKEPVAIPIDVAASPAPGEAWVPEAVEEPQALLTDAPEAIPTEETSASLEGLAATNGAPERS